MAGAPLEVIVKIADNFPAVKASKQARPDVERIDPTKVLIYKSESIEVYLSPDLQLQTPGKKLVTVGAKMMMWTGQQMTEEAVASVAGELRKLTQGPLTFKGDYSAELQQAYNSLPQPPSQA